MSKQSTGLIPFYKRPHSAKARLLILSTLLLLPLAQSHAAILSEDLLRGAFTDPASPASEAPSIEMNGREGAEAFANINIAPGPAGLDELKKIALNVITTNPKSGLAHEVLGTALFYSGDLPAALDEFQTAARLEPEQSGPWTKMGIVQMELEQLGDAEKSLQNALKQKPDNRIANQRLGLLYEYQQKNAQAIEYFKRGLAGTDNRYLGVALNLGRLLNNARRYDETIKQLAARVPPDSKVTEAHSILGAAYLATEQYDEAQNRFRKALETTPDSKENMLGLAISQRGKKDNQAAQATVKSLINKHPEWRSAYVEQGELLLQMDKVSDAEKSFVKAISLGSSSNYTDQKIAEYYSKKGDLDKAKRHYKKILDSDKASPDIYVKLAEILRSENDLTSGITILREGIQKYPQSSYLHFRLGSELAAMRQYQEALSSIAQANQLQPNDASILRAYSLVLSKLGEFSESAKIAGQLYKLQNENTPEALFYATQLQANNQLQEASSIYSSIIKSEPENIVALNNFANVLAAQGKLSEAETHARNVNQLAKGNAQVMDTLGWILYQQKRYAEAAEILTQAAKLAPKAAVIHYHAGVATDESGKDKEAAVLLKQALTLDAQAAWASDAKQRLSANN